MKNEDTRRERLGLIATESYPKYADEFVEKLFLQFELLSHNPELGVKRPEIGHGIRLYPVDSVNIIYRIMAQELQLLRVHHGALNSNQLQF